jgi:hypothetical protein
MGTVVKMHEDQVLYNDRWVDKKTFRVFVYDHFGKEKLAESYQEFEKLLATGCWFAKKPEASLKYNRKQKNVIRTDR